MKPLKLGRETLTLGKRLMSHVWPYRGAFFASVAGMIVAAATETGFAALLKPITDEALVKSNTDFIQKVPLLIIGLFLVRGIASFVGEYGMSWVGRRVVYDMRHDMFSRMMRLPASYFDRRPSSNLVSKLLYDVEQVAATTSTAFTSLLRGSVTTLGLLGWMFYLEWRLTLVFLIVVPALALVVNLASKYFRRTSHRIQETMAEIAHVSKEAIQGQRVVKIFGGEDLEDELFRRANERNRRQSMKRAMVRSLSVPLVQIIGAIALSVIIYVALIGVQAGSVTVGTFVSYLGAMVLMLSPTKRLARVNEIIQAGLAASQSVFALVDEPAEPDPGSIHIVRARGEIEYRNVWFRYDEREPWVVQDLSLRLEPGRTLALVGPSGAGKSTVAALLARFYAPQQGCIMLDGIELSAIRLADLRRNLSAVTQETLLFDASIRDNVTYGDRHVATARLERAIEIANVTEFASRMPRGLDTVIGEHGVFLSGGQRQRIAIARALYKDAPILILDEATSSLDADSERLVQEALRGLMLDRTTLVIAHRLSTIEQADMIVVMSAGQVVEQGTHHELVNGEGMYARLYGRLGGARQAAG